MIGLAISLMIQAIVLMIRLSVLAVRVMVVMTITLLAWIAEARARR